MDRPFVLQRDLQNLFMKKAKHLFFLFSVIILIVSEYFFLQEYFGESNMFMLLLTGAGVVTGIVGTITIIRKFY